MARKKRNNGNAGKAAEELAAKTPQKSTVPEIPKDIDVPTLEITYKHDVTGEEITKEITPKSPKSRLRLADGTKVRAADLLYVAKGIDVQGFPVDQDAAYSRIVDLAKMGYNF